MNLLVLLAGCALSMDPSPIDEMVVARAWLGDWSYGTAAFLGGGLTGETRVVVEDPDGNREAQSATFQGWLMGLAFHANTGNRDGRIELGLPPEPILGRQIWGTYDGTYEGGVVGAGIACLHLRNTDEVQIDVNGLGVGMAISVDWVRMWLAPLDVEGPDTGDTGETADTADSGTLPDR